MLNLLHNLPKLQPRKLLLTSLAIASGVGLILWGLCSPVFDRASPDPMIAQVGTASVPAWRFVSKWLAAGGSQLSSRSDREKLAHVILDRLIEEELVLLASKKQGLKISDAELSHVLRKNVSVFPVGDLRELLHQEASTPMQYKEALARSLLVEKFWTLQKEHLPKISQRAIESYLKKYPPILLPVRVHARQILLSTEESARFVRNQIQNGKLSFEAAAGRYSLAPEAEEFGDLGWFSKGEYPKVFDPCFALQKMEISDVVPSEYGFHLFYVLEHSGEQPESAAEAQARVKAALEHEQELNMIGSVMKRLKSQFTVAISERVLANTLQILPKPPKQRSL